VDSIELGFELYYKIIFFMPEIFYERRYCDAKESDLEIFILRNVIIIIVILVVSCTVTIFVTRSTSDQDQTSAISKYIL